MGVLSNMNYTFSQSPMAFMSGWHLILLVLTVLTVSGVIYYKSIRQYVRDDNIIKILLWISVVALIGKQIIFYLGGYQIKESLPLYFTDLMVFILLIWASTKSTLTENLIYYFGLLGAIVGVLFYPFFNPQFGLITVFDYLIYITILSVALYNYLYGGFVPRMRNFKAVAVTGVLLSAVIYCADYYLKSSYLYLTNIYKIVPLNQFGALFLDPFDLLILMAVIIGLWYLMVVFIEKKIKEDEIFTISNEYLERKTRVIR